MKNLMNTLNGLPSHLHDVLIGYMLGDGGIFYAAKKSATPRFEFSMGQDRLAFAQHLADLFKDYSKNSLKSVQVQAIAGGQPLTSYRFKTMSMDVFTYYRFLFYKVSEVTGKAVKVVPQNIAELLSPVALAYLIMADGNFDIRRNRVRIYTNSFTKNDVELLASALIKNFGLYAAVMEDKRDQFILTIGAKELPKLRDLVGKHMLPSMRYRVGL